MPAGRPTLRPPRSFTMPSLGFKPDLEQNAVAPIKPLETRVGAIDCKHGEGNYHQHETYNSWNKCAELLSKRDTENVAAWTAEVDSLLTFSGLLLTVVTLFIGTATPSLQPDSEAVIAAALVVISQQLHNNTIPGTTVSAFVPEPFQSDIVDLVVTSLLSTSLLVSLVASGMGLWVKEWLREYSLDLPYRARELVHVREYRHYGLARWQMRHIVASVSIMLMLAVTLFGIGITMMTWKVNVALSWVMTASLVVWTALVWSTGIIPTFSTHCPFKSPFARLVYRIHHLRIFKRTMEGKWKWRRFESIVDRERRRAHEQRTDLELQALSYVNDEYWGNEKLLKINKCFKDVENADKARECIEAIVAERVWGTSDRGKLKKAGQKNTDGRPVTALPTDEGVLHLLEIWETIGKGEKTPAESRAEGEVGQQKRWEEFSTVVVGSAPESRAGSERKPSFGSSITLNNFVPELTLFSELT
ncbi:hypothetical protein C8Q80DRAFT_1222992 [Daedaleopsis nitida]|nr:hypothetical protein C8Q80DRAFT_1222992 [Daedaleopsis nitida]